MKELFQRWLAANTLLPGVHACSVRFPDRACFTQVFGEQLKQDRLDQTWNTIIEMLPALNAQRLLPSLMVWNFEEGALHFATRPDGIALGIYTAPRAGDSAELQKLISDFLALA